MIGEPREDIQGTQSQERENKRVEMFYKGGNPCVSAI